MSALGDRGITLEGLAAAVDALRQELATWKALARKQDALSADQITATQSGATAAKISQIAVNTAAIQSLAAQVAGQIALEYVATLPATGEPLTLYLVPQGDGTAPNYCDEYLWINDAWELIGTTGAMANNGELTIQVNGAAVGTFTANQAANAAINIAVPTNTNQLVNGAQFVDAAALAAALTGKQDTLTTAQLEAVNSGITAAGVQQISTNTDAIATKAADSTVVHKAGAETISGDKTHDANLAITGNHLFAWDRPQVTMGTNPTSSVYFGTQRFRDANGDSFMLARGAVNAYGNTSYVLTLYPWSAPATACGWELNTTGDGSISYFRPVGAVHLGSTSSKWQSLNGVNPGALSFPGASTVDLSGDITDINGGINEYTPSVDGWIQIVVPNAADAYLSVRSYYSPFSGVSVMGNSSTLARLCITAPVRNGVKLVIYVKAASITSAVFRPCQGNV